MKENNRVLLRVLVIVLLDIIVIGFCCGLAFLVRFDFSVSAIPAEYKVVLTKFVCIQSVITVLVFWLRKMYGYIWRSVSMYDISNMILSVALAFLLSYAAARELGVRPPTSVAFIDLFLLLFAQVGMRCFLRFYSIVMREFHLRSSAVERIMMIGAGEAGRMLINEIQASGRVSGKVCCVIDDNAAKWGKQLNGVEIVGGRDQIPEMAEKYQITQIVFAIPSASAQQKKEILSICQQTGCEVRILPGVYQLVNGEVNLAMVKHVALEDLLGREPVKLDADKVWNCLQSKVVLVTGGGGSIGSELCRQIAKFSPSKLVVLDIYENNAYDLQQELRSRHPELELQVEIASVRDKEKVYALFERHRPEVVFHAAAHKHVPLMEHNPEEAIKNNVFGTYHVVRAAERYGVKKFVLISSDKAVNPTNIMGATKRYCEMILQSRPQSETEFCAVRFGNVLGSNGSVVPLFKKQIEAGGPVTLTDKRIIRYFMLIPEAAQLVLEAAAMAHRGQIFVLDMGAPVKILSLAENLIRLSGLEPYRDIEIKEIGLRPGEKLYEELLTKSDTLSKTANEKIMVEQQEIILEEQIRAGLELLDQAVSGEGDREELIALMKRLVPTYASPEEVNRMVEDKEEKVFAAAVTGGTGAYL